MGEFSLGEETTFVQDVQDFSTTSVARTDCSGLYVLGLEFVFPVLLHVILIDNEVVGENSCVSQVGSHFGCSWS
jgi:hypothetical protein